MSLAEPPVDLRADWLTVTPLEGRTGLRLTGEADLYTVPTLRRAAASLAPGACEIHLHLASLEFVDVAAARFLVSLTERPGQPVVVLHYPPPALIRLIRLLWPAALARLAWHDARPPPAPGLLP